MLDEIFLSRGQGVIRFVLVILQLATRNLLKFEEFSALIHGFEESLSHITPANYYATSKGVNVYDDML